MLALNRTVAIVLLSVLLFGLGEELWRSFVPLYFESQSKQVASEAAIEGAVHVEALWYVGIFACLLNLFEAACYVSGGQVTARLGDRGSLLLFGLMTIAGYVLFLLVPFAWATILACLLILGWEPLSVPVTFTTVGATVAKEKQGMAFALQSIQKRLPRLLGPVIAGVVLDWARHEWGRTEGTQFGMRVLVAGALALAVFSLAVQWRWMPSRKPPPQGPSAASIVRAFDPRLKRLLVAEIFTRWCDWLVREFVALYVVLVLGLSLASLGLLFALQHVVALLTYLPIGRMTQAVGLQPFIGLTFLFFALFPLALALVPDAAWLPVAFVVYGLREIGEPARKAMITSLMPEAVRARGVGLYWGLRSLAVCWAALVGACLWQAWGPEALLYCAFALGCVGAAIFYTLVRQSGPTLPESDN